jgi:fumarylacetoacetate (FAA) hydrolase family protein
MKTATFVPGRGKTSKEGIFSRKIGGKLKMSIPNFGTA